jgi:hypothetical protein
MRGLEPGFAQIEAHALAARDLGVVLAGLPELADLTVTETLRLAPGRAVFLAERAGLPVIVKHLTGPQRAAQAQAVADEILHATDRLSGTPHRVAGLIAVAPAQGIICTHYAPGQRLDRLLVDLPRDEQLALLARAAEWLAAFTALRRKQGPFGAWYWVKQAAAVDLQELDPEGQALARAIRARLRAMAPALAGRPVLRVATHGDFVDSNLHWHDGTLWAFDLGGTQWLPLAHTVAHFLLWRAMADPLPASRHFGLPADLVAGFLGGGILPADQLPILRFLLGLAMLRRLPQTGRRPDRAARLRAAIQGWLADGA